MTLSFPLVLMDADSYAAGMHCTIGAKNFFAHKKTFSRFTLLFNLISLRETTRNDFSDDDKVWMSGEVQCIYMDMVLRGIIPSSQTSLTLPGWQLFVAFVSHTHPDQLIQSLDARFLSHEHELSQQLGQAVGQESFPWYMTNIV
ncbi:MAG: hypothetical protein NZL83_01725, partial [Candidatus Absconditabacterales bacterium]|nr:hypothetical protein [Candidatus Absconditabacterales bacterium]